MHFWRRRWPWSNALQCAFTAQVDSHFRNPVNRLHTAQCIPTRNRECRTDNSRRARSDILPRLPTDHRAHLPERCRRRRHLRWTWWIRRSPPNPLKWSRRFPLWSRPILPYLRSSLKWSRPYFHPRSRRCHPLHHHNPPKEKPQQERLSLPSCSHFIKSHPKDLFS